MTTPLVQPQLLWLTGLSGAGKSALAQSLAARLRARGESVVILDGDEVREGLCADLDFSDAGRAENVRRIGEVAKLILDSGHTVIVAAISPFRRDRERVRQRIGQDRFTEVFVDCPLAVCQQRDPKKLYEKARRGTLQKMTGISSPYEPPENPSIHVRTDLMTVQQATDAVLSEIARDA